MKASPIPISNEDLWETMALDPLTGRLFPRFDCKKRSWKIDRQLGTTRPAGNGYHYISINGKRVLAHRLVFKWVHGVDPLSEVDHIDRNRANNSPFNLRLSSRRGQTINSPVHILAAGTAFSQGKWIAYHALNGKQFTIGGFTTEAEAFAARRALVYACAHFEKLLTQSNDDNNGDA